MYFRNVFVFINYNDHYYSYDLIMLSDVTYITNVAYIPNTAECS